MRSAWIALIVLAGMPQGVPAGENHLTEQQKLGRRLFEQSCGVCHTRPTLVSGMYGPELSFGGTLARVNIHTWETTLIPLPNPEAHQPYQIGVDRAHNVWTNLWSTDKVAKYDPGTGQWTLFDLPTRGTEARHISLLEREGQPLQVVIPYDRGRKVGVLTPRTETELRALKEQTRQ